MITVEHLRHDYEGKGNYAVDDISFQVPPGHIFGFLGPSGAGKSTVQNILTGLLPLQEGEATLAGQTVRRLRPVFFNRIGYSFEHPNLFGKLTALENLRFYAGLFAVPTLDPFQLLERVGLGGSAHKRVAQYSKGMKQRLLFVRSIMHRPDILFLDEPESGLDPSTALVIKQMIREERDRGAAVLLTTHNMYAADELCDQVAFMDHGRILAAGSPRQLKLQ
ncbi:MAG: ATP-binding protein, partial [Spirochaetes bacterium GWC1_61_12]